MIKFLQGNLLQANAEALVNTVNTVGIMGKGIALMFKDSFKKNFMEYEAACRRGEVKIGRMFVTEQTEMLGPKWIINFPTKEDWRRKSRIEWIDLGLEDLRRVIIQKRIRSIALPPLGSGNGGLDWQEVRQRMVSALGDLPNVEVLIYEPTSRYQNVSKRKGVENLTPARALVAELIRRYALLGIDCTVLEVQKLVYFLERKIESLGIENPLCLEFRANKFGPYAPKLTHILDGLDGSYLHCEKRLADATPYDVIWFDEKRKERVSAYLTKPEARSYRGALDATDALIDGFQSPLGMELLATVDWLLAKESAPATLAGIKHSLRSWPGGRAAAQRKLRLFDDRLIGLALDRLS